MDYQQADKIRGKSFASLMTEKLAEGGGIGGSLRATVSERSQARMKGIKEKFDILNIAKMMTGGSNLAPAILGRILGRSTRDIKYFTGIKDKKTASKLGPTGDGVSPEMMNILGKIYDFLKETNDEDRLKKQSESQFAEEKELERMRRHKELMQAITGKPYTQKIVTATKLDEEDDGSFLDKFLRMLGIGKNTWKNLKFALGVLGLVGGMVGFYGGLLWLVNKMNEITPNMKALSPEEARNVLQNGSPKDIEAAGGRQFLENIILNRKQEAIDVLAMEPGEERDKRIRQLGGEDKLNKIVADTKVYEVPAPRAVGEDMAEKLPFTKEQFIGKGTARRVKEDKWNKQYAPFYNDDGTLKQELKVQPKDAVVNRTPEQAFQELNENPNLLKSEPVNTSNVGNKLNVLQGENLMAKIDDKTEVAKAITTNNVIKNSLNSSAKRGYIPSVRNQEETFQQMILQSTRVV